jgi:hypothetical protein
VLVTSNVIDCPEEELSVGMPVRVAWEQIDASPSPYRFRPERTRRE